MKRRAISVVMVGLLVTAIPLVSGEALDGGDMSRHVVSASSDAPVYLQSAWAENGVTVDGSISDGSEWASAPPVDVPLHG